MKPSPELIQKTIVTFSPYYERQITRSEAEEIIFNVGQLLDVLEDVSPEHGENIEKKNFKM